MRATVVPLLFATAAVALTGICPGQEFGFGQSPQVRDRVPGSVLIFMGHRSAGMNFTILTVTNTNPTPEAPDSFGGSIRVHFEYVNTQYNPADPFCPLDCVVFDRHEFMTPSDTLSVLTRCHNATTPQMAEGYVVVSAQDPAQFGVDVCFDYLMGTQFLFNASGMFFMLNAQPIQCAAGPTGTPTDLNNNGKLDFDGREYRTLPDKIYIESFIAVPRTRLCLINLTGECVDTNQLYFAIYNDNEVPLSATRSFKTWFDQPLELVSPAFSQTFLRSVPNDPRELDLFCNGQGVLETGWAMIESIGVRASGGQLVAPDGVVLGCIASGIGGDPLLWSSYETQNNGVFLGRPTPD